MSRSPNDAWAHAAGCSQEEIFQSGAHPVRHLPLISSTKSLGCFLCSHNALQPVAHLAREILKHCKVKNGHPTPLIDPPCKVNENPVTQ